MLEKRHATLLRSLVAISLIAACSRSQPEKKDSVVADTGFGTMQHRGGMAMGVDQYTSTHMFDVTPDGGRVQLQRDTKDSLGVAQIRAHMKLIQHAFEAGDFSTPAFVHARDMPGTAVMTKKRNAIKYEYADLPSGGEVRVTSSDPEAIAAIHEFMLAQRMDHRAGGH
ncbi:MAG: hypothetical protein ABI875_08270 [Gemmatimonadales bacterium]